MANMYRSVLAGGGGVQPTGDAVEANVLAGKTFSNADGIGKTGTMPNNGAVSVNLNVGQSYTVPAGYHNGNGVVNAPSGAAINTSFTPDRTGISENASAGNNFTVGKYYMVMIGGVTTTSNVLSGCTEIARVATAGADNFASVLVRATATEIKFGTGNSGSCRAANVEITA